MESRWDGLAKQLGEYATRRRMMQGLGVLGVGTLGTLALPLSAQARCRTSCRCRKHESRRKCLRRCKRKCD
jgi:hypothetical protein